jgi:4-amino-4-deoxy-L-arabinose transferase-like glycosyltransferase
LSLENNSENRSTAVWRGGYALAGLIGVVFFLVPLLLAARIPLLDPDEGLHATIAQQMAERGDWITPRLNGKPFLDKPILYFWAEAASIRAFGSTEAAVRLPGLLLGLLGVVTIGLAATRWFNRTTGLLAALFYATTFMPTGLAQASVHDVAMVPLVNLSLLLLWESQRAATTRRAWVATAAVGTLLGLTMLTKGLTGIALVGVAYGSYLLVTRQLRRALCIRGAAAVAIGLLVASGWYLAVESQNPGYLRYYFIQRHLLGFTTATQLHGGEPWWYYLPLLAGGGLPWIIYLPILVRDHWAKWRASGRSLATPRTAPLGDDAPVVLVWCWLIACTIFLSAAHSKLVTYLWPVYPAVAVLAAVAWGRLWDGSLAEVARRELNRTFRHSSAAGPLVLPAVVIAAQTIVGVRVAASTWWLVAVAALAAWAPFWFWHTGRQRGAVAAGLLSLAAQFLVLMAVVLPTFAENYSDRALARHFNTIGRLPPHLFLADERLGSLYFYLDPPLRTALEHEQIQSIDVGKMSQFTGKDAASMVAVSDRRAAAVQETLDLSRIDCQVVGHHRLYRTADLLSIPRTAAAPTGSVLR